MPRLMIIMDSDFTDDEAVAIIQRLRDVEQAQAQATFQRQLGGRMLNMTDPEYVVCRNCGNWMAFGGYDVACGNCGACDWAPADDFGNELSDEEIERLGIRTQEG